MINTGMVFSGMTAYLNTHSKIIGYLLWIFGVFGAHRFYYGRPISGTIWFFTLGLLFIGWIVDLFLIPGMDRDADHKYEPGPVDYSVAWLLLTFLGVFGIHRMYMGKWLSGIAFTVLSLLFGFSLFTIVLAIPFGLILALYWIYDYWTLNSQISEINRRS